MVKQISGYMVLGATTISKYSECIIVRFRDSTALRLGKLLPSRNMTFTNLRIKTLPNIYSKQHGT